MGALTGFRIRKLFHPTAIIIDLTQLADFYEKVFGGRPRSHPYEPYTNQYRSFKLISDTWIEHMSPEQTQFSAFRLFTNIVGSHWAFPCFYVDDMQDLVYRFWHGHGIRLNSLEGAPVTGFPPGPGAGTGRTLLWTHPWDTGISWEFWEGEPEFVLGPLGDPRRHAGWKLAPPTAPLHIEHTAHHTVVVEDRTKILKFLTEICQGSIFAEEDDKAAGTLSTWVALGDGISVFEIAQPYREGPRANDLLRAGNTYHSLNFKVSDLDEVATHLAKQNIQLDTRNDKLIVTDPKSCSGLRFGFTAALHDRDPRIGATR